MSEDVSECGGRKTENRHGLTKIKEANNRNGKKSERRMGHAHTHTHTHSLSPSKISTFTLLYGHVSRYSQCIADGAQCEYMCWVLRSSEGEWQTSQCAQSDINLKLKCVNLSRWEWVWSVAVFRSQIAVGISLTNVCLDINLYFICILCFFSTFHSFVSSFCTISAVFMRGSSNFLAPYCVHQTYGIPHV